MYRLNSNDVIIISLNVEQYSSFEGICIAALAKGKIKLVADKFSLF